MQRDDFLNFLDNELQPNKVKDFCPNGLQVEGSESISTIVTGVTASEALIDAAIAQNADTILVHHGYFWKGESPVVKGMKKRRLSKLLAHNINLIAYHLPLDIHPTLGNNAQLAKRLGITAPQGLDVGNPVSVAMQGEFEIPLSADALKSRIEQSLQRDVLLSEVPNKLIRTVAYCTGGGQGYIEQAAELGIDAFITGEVSEQTIHTSREMGIHFFACGHHATERYGAKALGEHIQAELGIKVTFVDIDNPA